MEAREVNHYFEQIRNLRVMVIGDVMIDSYIFGKVNRISPEAPVPVVEVLKRENRLGGAANVALNLASLGCVPHLASAIGKDREADVFLDLMQEAQLPITAISRCSKPTTVKTRVVAGSQQLLRVDSEKSEPLPPEDAEHFIKLVEKVLMEQKIELLIFEDYDKGLLESETIAHLIALAKNKGVWIAVDPKKKHFFSYQGVDLFKPNLKELREGLSLPVAEVNLQSLDAADEQLRKLLGHSCSLITLGEKGVFFDDGTQMGILPAHVRNISDVSGAGDTVISVAATALRLGFGLEKAAWLANIAGGLVCEKLGVVPVAKEDLRKEALKLATES